jgi:hypothetical protein
MRVYIRVQARIDNSKLIEKTFLRCNEPGKISRFQPEKIESAMNELRT